jgi:hypothetical protein
VAGARDDAHLHSAGKISPIPAATTAALLAGVRGSGGMAESPRPGMSGTHSS